MLGLHDFHYSFIKKNWCWHVIYWRRQSYLWNSSWICWIKVKDALYKNIDGKEFNKAKGVIIATEFKEFKDTLFNKKWSGIKWKYFKVKQHRLGTYEINKISLSCFDDNKTMATDKLTEKLHMKLRIHQYIFLVGQMYSWLYVLLNSRF